MNFAHNSNSEQPLFARSDQDRARRSVAMTACWARHRTMLERAKVAGADVILDVGPRSPQTKYLRALWYAAGQPCEFFAFDPWGDHRPTPEVCDAVFAQTLIDQEWRRRLFGSVPESLEGA